MSIIFEIYDFTTRNSVYTTNDTQCIIHKETNTTELHCQSKHFPPEFANKNALFSRELCKLHRTKANITALDFVEFLFAFYSVNVPFSLSRTLFLLHLYTYSALLLL